jgi:hypothetical protein
MNRHPEWVDVLGLAQAKDLVEAPCERTLSFEGNSIKLKQILRRSVRAIIPGVPLRMKELMGLYLAGVITTLLKSIGP